MGFFGVAYIVTNHAPQLCACVNCMERSTDESLWARVTNACPLVRDGKSNVSRRVAGCEARIDCPSGNQINMIDEKFSQTLMYSNWTFSNRRKNRK